MKSVDDLRKDHFELFKRVVETGEPKHYEYYDDHLGKWLNISVAKMMDGVVTTATDVTASKKAADLIAQNYEDLKITSGKLETSNTQLEQSNLDLMQFASVASHDLKEPLRKIETFGNLLYAKLKERFEDGETKYLQKIIKSSHRMQVLIEDVLTFSKLSNSELPVEKIDLNRIVNRIKEDLEITIKERNADLQVSQLPVVCAVGGQMHQLFQNLISNGLKFNDKKKPGIIISEKSIPMNHVQDLKINPEDYLCISVKDDGIGIDEKFKEKIFGIFQRLHGNQFEGTGIGLAICKKIVEKHKGCLLVDSVPHQGSEFFVILPRQLNSLMKPDHEIEASVP